MIACFPDTTGTAYPETEDCGATGCGSGSCCTRYSCPINASTTERIISGCRFVGYQEEEPEDDEPLPGEYWDFLWEENICWQDCRAYDDQRQPERHFHRQRYIRAAQRRRGPRPIRGLGSRRG